MGSISTLINSLGVVRMAILGVVTVSLLGFFAYLGLKMSVEPKALLFSDIAAEDTAKMMDTLDGMKVPYELKGDGTKIYVPESQVLRLRMTLASKGLLTGGTVGYEIFDNADALGTTNFLQNINHLRALEGELSRTIRAIEGIAAARVHLVLPERELFSRDKREPSASIVLKVRGSLAMQQVKAIQYLVASAVDGLKPGHVSLVDEHGTLLASGMGDDSQAVLAANIDEKRAAYETKLRTQIEDIVQRVVGLDKARVEVNAQMNYNRVTATSDSYDPNGQVVRSTQTVEDSSSNTDGKQSQAVSVGNNMPNASLAAPGENGEASQQKAARTEETVNYEISRTTKTEVLEAGRLERLSIAVLVDGRYAKGANGEATYTPRNADELSKIEALVKSAMGFDQKRGDHVEIVNLRFADAPVAGEAGGVEAAAAAGLTKADYFRMGQFGVLSILALLTLLFVFRPAFSRLAASLPPLRKTAAAPAAHALVENPLAQNAGLIEPPTELQMAIDNVNQKAIADDMMIDIAQVAGKVRHSSVKKIGELVTGHPDESISILRSWLHEPA